MATALSYHKKSLGKPLSVRAMKFPIIDSCGHKFRNSEELANLHSGMLSLNANIVCGEWVVTGVDDLSLKRVVLTQGSTKARAWVKAALESMFKANKLGVKFYDLRTLMFLTRYWSANDRNNPEYLWMLNQIPKLKSWS